MPILQGENQAMQVYQIAERMVSPQSDISRLIDRMVTAKLVSRERYGQDRRVVWVKLTSKKRQIATARTCGTCQEVAPITIWDVESSGDTVTKSTFVSS